MVTVVQPGLFRPVSEFAPARALWPRGLRPDALRDAAADFRRRFKAEGTVQGVRSVDIAAVAYPTRFAFHGAAKSPSPYVSIVNRLIFVQFEGFDGELKTLAWEPTVPAGSAEAPFYAQLIQRYGPTLAHKVFASYYNSIETALQRCGLRAGDIDYAAFDHLHVQDMRYLLGTIEPVHGEPAPREPAFPNAKFLSKRVEVDTLRCPHPLQWAWYVPGGMDSVRRENQIELDGDIHLGVGVAIVGTPGHTDGNQSLVVNTPDGVWVSSENGIAADNWQPELSRIPGVRRQARFFRHEVVMNANTLEDPLDQYDSMVLEKSLADPNRRDPRWWNILPSSELSRFKRHWPIVSSFFHGGIDYGRIVAPGPRG